MTPRKITLDETALAKRLAVGDSMKQCADDLGVTHPVVARRVKAWRMVLAERAGEDLKRVLYWRDTASPGRVARRWLYVTTGDERWSPTDVEVDES